MSINGFNPPPNTGTGSLRNPNVPGGGQKPYGNEQKAELLKWMSEGKGTGRLDGDRANLGTGHTGSLARDRAVGEGWNASEDLEVVKAQVGSVKNAGELAGLRQKATEFEGKIAHSERAIKEADEAAKSARQAMFTRGVPCASHHPRNDRQGFKLSEDFFRSEPKEPDPKTLSGQLTLAERSVNKIDQAARDVQSADPVKKANAMAAQLAQPRALATSIAGLGPIKNAPIVVDLKAQTAAIDRHSNTKALGEALKANPDLKAYEPGMAKNLVALRSLQDPNLAAPIAAISRNALGDAQTGPRNPLAADNVARDPDAARLIASNSQGNDPVAKGQMRQLAQDAAQQSLQKHLNQAKPGEAGAKQALENFQNDMQELAKTGVDISMVAAATQKACADTDNQKAIVQKIEDGKGYFEKATDLVKGLVGNVVKSVEGFASKAADHCLKEVDAALDKSVLGTDETVFKDANAHMMGRLLTNRLVIGEATAVELSANGKVSGVDVGAAAKMEIKRVAKTDAEGNALPDKDGVPASLIQIKLSVAAKAGVGIEASFRKSAQVKGAAGVDVSASLKAEAGLKGQATLTLSFDATNPNDMQQLSEMFNEAATAGLKSTIPGIGPLLASGDAAKVAEIGWNHRESLRIDGGVYAGTETEATSKLTAGGATEKSTKGVEVEHTFQKKKGAEPGEEKEPAVSLDGLAPSVEAGVKAGLRGEVSMGREWNLRNGDTTTYLNVKGEAQFQANAGEANAGKGVSYNREIGVTRDGQGKLKGVNVTDEFGESDFKGLGRKDIMDRVDSDLLLQVEYEDTVAVNRTMTPEAMKGLQDKNALQIAARVFEVDAPGNKALEVDTVVATHTTSGEAGGQVLGTGVSIKFSHSQDKQLNKK